MPVPVATADHPAVRLRSGPRALVLALAAAACSGRSAPPVQPAPSAAPPPGGLRPPSQFASIADRTQRSQALFVEAGRVLTHARCVNCHPPDDTPRQGDAGALHDPPVLRGTADRGIPALGCMTCHQDRNVELARVPGAPDWHLAPAQMVWLGKSAAAICTQIKDPARNGGRSLAQIQDHMAHDALVGWAWQPGAGREPAPGTQAELGALVQAWIDTGAACPTEETKR
ncbi:MAG TPA: Isoquinoline 1-oxidoreductase subunit [Kofleriaceae bacterium]